MILGMTFNSIHSSVLNANLTDVQIPRSSQPRDTYVNIPKLDKTIVFNSGREDIQLSVELTVQDDETALRNIDKWLYTEDKVPLIFDKNPDIYYMAKVSGSIEENDNDDVGYVSLTVNFTAEGYKYSVETESIETVNDDSMHINNTGTYTALPVFYIDVSSELTRLTFTLDTQILTFEGTVSPGSKLVIDCENIEVYTLNSSVKTDASLNVEGEFLQIPIGDNEITVEIEGVATIKTEWRRRYV